MIHRGEAFTINGQLDSLVLWNLYLFDIDFKPELLAGRFQRLREAKRSSPHCNTPWLQLHTEATTKRFIRAISLFIRGIIQYSFFNSFFF